MNKMETKMEEMGMEIAKLNATLVEYEVRIKKLEGIYVE